MGRILKETDHLVVLSTTAPGTGEALAQGVVEAGLAACVNICPVRSVFVWEGKTCLEGEELLVMKTSPKKVEALAEKIKELHSYQVPEILIIPLLAGEERYLDWMAKSLGLKGKT